MRGALLPLLLFAALVFALTRDRGRRRSPWWAVTISAILAALAFTPPDRRRRMTPLPMAAAPPDAGTDGGHTEIAAPAEDVQARAWESRYGGEGQ